MDTSPLVILQLEMVWLTQEAEVEEGLTTLQVGQEGLAWFLFESRAPVLYPLLFVSTVLLGAIHLLLDFPIRQDVDCATLVFMEQAPDYNHHQDAKPVLLVPMAQAPASPRRSRAPSVR